MEALLLAGGKAERLGEATQGLPKPLVPVAGFPLEEYGAVSGFREAPMLDHWVNSGVYVLGEEALERLPERGDHELTTFPELAAEGKLRGHRHTGVWLTVNTPKDLRRAADFMEEHPDWKP